MPLHFPSIHRVAHVMATGSPSTVILKKPGNIINTTLQKKENV
jgi:hypothetical protein